MIVEKAVTVAMAVVLACLASYAVRYQLGAVDAAVAARWQAVAQVAERGMR